MALSQIIAQLRSAVGGLVPTTAPDIRFDCPRPGVIAAPVDWMTNPDRRTRDFDVYVSELPVRSAGGGCSMIAGVHVVIAYRLDQGLDLVDQLMVEDAELFSCSVELSPSAWSHADSLTVPDPAEVERLEYTDGTPAIALVRHTCSVIYRVT